MAESIKSRFRPTFPRKYKGNANNIICRSSWERRFCNYCDINESIIEWGSEEFFIPYVSPKDNRVHKYYPDFIIKVKESTGHLKTYVIEVKPKKQTEPPKKRKYLAGNGKPHGKYDQLQMQMEMDGCTQSILVITTMIFKALQSHDP